MTIGEIKYLQPKSNAILMKYGFDTSNNNQEFEEACAVFGLNPLTIKGELIDLQYGRKLESRQFNKFVKRILKNHSIVKAYVSSIRESLRLAVTQEASAPYPIQSIKEKFEILAEHLEVHLYKEEVLLFPEFLLLWQKQTQQVESNSFSLTYPIETLEADHTSVKSLLAEIKHSFRPYKKHQNTKKYCAIAFNQIEVLEKIIHSLINIESKILFPEALALEQKIYSANKNR